MREVKTFPLVDFKVSDDAVGTFTGRASTFDTIDAVGDTIHRGAYENTLPDFLKKGFIAWAHDWANPIAMPMKAEERADGLHIEAKFHSDPQAQMYRTRVKERVDAGQFMGLSIGYNPVKWHMEEDVRVLDEIKLYEVSLVTVPAEEHSGLITVKGFDLPIEDHSEQLRVALREFFSRVEAGSAERAKAGRAISAARRTLIESVSGSLRTHADALDGLLTAPAVDEPDEEEEPVVGLSLPQPVDESLQALAERVSWLLERYPALT